MRRTFLTAACIAFAAAGGAGAQEAPRPYLAGSLTFTDERPGQATGVRGVADFFDPADPDGKPPAARDAVFQFAPGTVIDTSVPDKCGASDAELMAAGASACPAASRVGGGEAIVDTGVPGPGRDVTADLVVLNDTDELIFLATERSSGLRVILHGYLESPDRFDTHAPMLPGTPPSGGSLDYVALDLFRLTRVVGGVERSYITAPATCDGTWVNTVLFSFDDGVQQLYTTNSPCEPTRAADDSRGGRCAEARRGTPAADELVGTPAGELLRGRGGDDVLRGGPGDDCLFGDGGRDRVSGGPGADALHGGHGTDRLDGGRGDDRIRSRDGGPDVVRCGAGRDVAIADRADSVRGCERVR